jgi:hypothetical protein
MHAYIPYRVQRKNLPSCEAFSGFGFGEIGFLHMDDVWRYGCTLARCGWLAKGKDAIMDGYSTNYFHCTSVCFVHRKLSPVC